MAKGISFNFGANRKPKKSAKGTGRKGSKSGSGRKSGSGQRSNAWRSYVGSNAPIPD